MGGASWLCGRDGRSDLPGGKSGIQPDLREVYAASNRQGEAQGAKAPQSVFWWRQESKG